MKTAAVGINNTRLENTPDLELSASEMMVVHRWLAMASVDVTNQLEVMKPPAIAAKETKARVATTIIGTKFLQQWINANMSQIEDALEAAGVIPDIVFNDGEIEELH